MDEASTPRQYIGDCLKSSVRMRRKAFRHDHSREEWAKKVERPECVAMVHEENLVVRADGAELLSRRAAPELPIIKS